MSDNPQPNDANPPPPASATPMLSEAEQQRLVAYLDGELSAQDCQQIESQLASNTPLRAELQRLDRVWNALDHLPQAIVKEDFSRTTVEMIATEAEKEVAQLTTALPIGRPNHRLGAYFAFVAAALMGFVLMRVAQNAPNRQLLADLPMIYQTDALQQFQEIAFLNKLYEKGGALIEEYSDDPLEEKIEAWRTIEQSSAKDRATWVNSLSENKKARLYDAAKRFNSLAPATREQTEQLYQQITSAPNADQLRRITVVYHAWLATQTPGVQSELRQIEDADRRLRRIQSIVRSDQREAKRPLSADDAHALRKAIKDLADRPELTQFRQAIVQRLDVIKDRLDSRPRGKEPAKQLERRRRMVEARFRTFPAWPLVGLADLATNSRGPLSAPLHALLQEDYPAMQQQATEVWPVVEQQLIASLSDSAQQKLQRVTNRKKRIEILRAWIIEVTRSAFEPEDIEAFFASNSLTDRERHTLLGLPAEEMNEELRQMYIRRELGIDPQMVKNWRRFGHDKPTNRAAPGRFESRRRRGETRGELRNPP